MTTIWDHIATELPYLQAQAEGGMRERIVIDRVTGTIVDDEGREQVTYATIYDGIGKLRTFRPYEQNPDVAAGTVTKQRTDWHIPAAERMAHLLTTGQVTEWAGPVLAGDRARRLTPGKEAKTVRVAGEHEMTWQTAQRLVVDDITGGEFA